MKTLRGDQLWDQLSARSRDRRTPEDFTFELTYACNLRCVHCYNPTHRALPHELSTAEAFAILRQAADMGVVKVTFSGGEPLVRPDAFDIFHEARRLGFVVILLSNATQFTATVADALEEIDCDTIGVSIYGATQETYERVTGVPGSYPPFVRGLEHAASRRLPVVVRMPVMTENAHEIHEARALAERLGLKFQYCLDITPRTDGDVSPLAHRLSPKQKIEINNAFVGHTTVSKANAACSKTDDLISCACGRNRFAVTPYGEMNLCVAFPMPKYDLRNGTLQDGWEVLKQTVDHAQPSEQYECPGCDLRLHCKQGPSDAWLETGDMSRCLPHFKEFARLERHVHELLDPRQPV